MRRAREPPRTSSEATHLQAPLMDAANKEEIAYGSNMPLTISTAGGAQHTSFATGLRGGLSPGPGQRFPTGALPSRPKNPSSIAPGQPSAIARQRDKFVPLPDGDHTAEQPPGAGGDVEVSSHGILPPESLRLHACLPFCVVISRDCPSLRSSSVAADRIPSDPICGVGPDIPL